MYRIRHQSLAVEVEVELHGTKTRIDRILHIGEVVSLPHLELTLVQIILLLHQSRECCLLVHIHHHILLHEELQVIPVLRDASRSKDNILSLECGLHLSVTFKVEGESRRKLH